MKTIELLIHLHCFSVEQTRKKPNVLNQKKKKSVCVKLSEL